MTIINYNNGRISDKAVATKPTKVRKRVTSSDNQGATIVSFNDGRKA
jgi:hypothetical protein